MQPSTSVDEIESMRPIPGYSGYAATRDGGIYSIASNYRGYGIFRMATRNNLYGYPTVSIRRDRDGKRVVVAVHAMIGFTFLPERPTPKHEVRHLDGDKNNSSADNLRWGTKQENAADREAHGRTPRGVTHGQSKLNPESVLQIRARHKEGVSLSQLARDYGIRRQSITKVIRGISWGHI